MAPPLNDVTNTHARRAAKPPCKPMLLSVEPAASVEAGGGDVVALAHSFRGMALAPLQQTAAQEEEQVLAVRQSNQLDVSVAAFAAAKARLQQSTFEADSRISSTLRALGSMRRSSALGRLRGEAGLEVAEGGMTSPAVAALQKRNSVLKERLHSTMALCTSLHSQNQESLELVAELRLDNMQLSASLREARLDKDALQQAIRQLTQEAALLAEQARLVLLPAEAASGGLLAIAPVPAVQEVAVAAAAAAAPEESLSLLRDWSCALSEASSCSSGRQGAAWLPGTSVHSFECSASYAQAGSGEGAGDKRRRLTPGMLAHCLRPAIAAAVAEAAAMEAGGLCPAPGRTPKRKLRQMGNASLAPPAVAPAPDAATPVPAASPAIATASTHHTAPLRLFVGADVAQQAAQHGMQLQGRDVAAPPAAVLEHQSFHTFDLIDAKWHGGSAQQQVIAVVPAPSSRRLKPGCSIM